MYRGGSSCRPRRFPSVTRCSSVEVWRWDFEMFEHVRPMCLLGMHQNLKRDESGVDRGTDCIVLKHQQIRIIHDLLVLCDSTKRSLTILTDHSMIGREGEQVSRP